MSFSSNILLSISENDLNTSSELPRNSLSSKKDDLINKSRSTFDISSEDKNSNRTSSKFPKNLFFTLDVSPIKKRSKISIQMEELENRKKENDELLQEINSEIVSDEFENELDEITKNLGVSDNFNEQYEKFDVFFYFTIQNKEFVYQIKSDLFNINSQCI